ncbi:hypothetical protein EDD37DRAFT_661579 [Exophiala viscosa]|uniref:Uncharacterized protein n=1 Tax=Exophiala viscosa TaxID=2486360 RepID=A0AAN6E3Q9_9EURO|nr:hypothetical protein EDD36DRAFT_461652 [Exophiala viscosa]KAI1629661.1 hypothetical protein EDD37DRAFT_661579 [Exophiala viscosa]
MKETLRKKTAKTDSNSEFDTASEAPSNPWASETSSAVNGDTLSRQSTKASKSPDTVSPNRSIPPSVTEEKHQSPPPTPAARLDVPGADNGTDDASKPTRRRKTITKKPHTFELEADLNPVKPKEQPPAMPSEPPKPETPAPKKKKRVSQPPAAETPPAVTINSLPSVQQAPPALSPAVASPKPPPAAPMSPPIQSPPQMTAPASPKPPSTPSTPSTPIANNPFTAHRTKKSVSSAPIQIAGSNPCRFSPPRLADEAFYGKVIVLTHGASQTGQALIRQFHAAGCRIIFGDTNGDQARKLISSLPPPHVVHFNKCDLTSYSDILELFKLATTMYGRVDHAIFGVGDDGGQARTVGEGEKGWFEDRPGVNKTFRMAVSEIEREPYGLGDILTASVRFARIAMAYLKYSPKSKPKKKIVNPYAKTEPEPSAGFPAKDDRSLTFVTSIAAFKETPMLPIYQITQHSILGLVRSLRSTVDPDPERDGVRINAVATNVMVPRAVAQSGGRMSVALPPDRPEDVARVVAGVVATSTSNTGNDTGVTHGGGIWYEKGYERGMTERYLHGRVIYSVGLDCWDVQEGMDRSEPVWMGAKSSDALARAMNGLNVGSAAVTGQGSNWILDFV